MAKKEQITEVTTVAKEEEKTGEKIPVPKEEELVKMAGSSLLNSLVRLEKEFADLSSRAKTRVMAAILSMPTDGIPVKLQSDKEKLCFAIGQRALTDRFLLTQYHINQEVKRQKDEAEKMQTEKKEKEPNEQT